MSTDEKKLMEEFEKYHRLLHGESFKHVKGTKEASISNEKAIPIYDNGKLIGYYYEK